MSQGYELEGTILLIEDIQEFKSGFTKREFVVDVADGQYSQQIKFEAVKEKTSLTDGLQKGDAVKVFFDIRGNEYNGRYYVNLNAWKLEKAGAGGGSAPASSPAAGDAIPADDGGSPPPSHEREAPPGAVSDAAEDDIPF